MRLLILGGGRFVGRAVLTEALSRDWQVTTFSRRGTAHVAPGVDARRGDRLNPEDLAVLRAGRWDLAVDTWAGAPRAVLHSAQTLADSVDHYVYISSRSVYQAPLRDGATEDDAVVASSPDSEGGTYGECKAGGELAATAVFGDRALVARAGLILGPNEYVPRLTWWLRRVARGGPGPGAGSAGPSAAVRRCPRPGGVGARQRGSEAERPVQRGQPVRPHHDREAARVLCPCDELRRHPLLGGSRGDPRRRYRAVE